MRKLGDTIVFDFTTHDPETGEVSDADITPTCEVFEDTNDTELLVPTVTKRTGKTGDYRVSIEATTPNGFEIGKNYNVIVSATVNDIPAKARIATFTLESKRIGDLNDIPQSSIDAVNDKIQDEIIDKKNEFKADVSGLALESTTQDIKNKTNLIPPVPASETTLLAVGVEVVSKASQTSVDALNNLSISDIEGSSLAKEASLAPLAKDTTVAKDNTVAKEATLNGKASQASVDGKPTLTEIEELLVPLAKDATVAKEDTLNNVKVETDKIQPEILDKKDEFKADISSLAKDATVAKEDTLTHIKEKTDLIIPNGATQASIDSVIHEIEVNRLVSETNQLYIIEAQAQLDSAQVAIDLAVNKILRLAQIEEGHWKIENDKLIIYDPETDVVIRTFTLKGEQTKAYSERIPD
jgi:hypothetical protein